MTRLRSALIGVAALAILLVLAVWQVPQWLDWTRYRSTIEVLASATLGQPVAIRGPISLTLLPEPVLTAAQVDVGGSVPTDLSIYVEALRLRIALWPLLRGHVDARELVLRGPDLHIPWPAQPGMLRPRPPAWLAAFAARIENGRLTVGQLAFTGINATLATLDTGALSAAGTAQFSGQDWHFTARLTAAGPDGASGLNVTLDGQGKANGLGANFTGQLADDGTLIGTLASRGPNLGLWLPTPAVPFRADGRLTVGSGRAAFDDAVLEINGSPASGSVALQVAPHQRLDVALSASRLDLDAWLPVLLRAGTTVAGIDMPIGIDVSAESAPLGGGTLEHVRAAFELVGTHLVVRDATASLPGNARLRLTGRVTRDDTAQQWLEGDVRLDAPVLRTTLRWLEEALPGHLPPRLLAGLPNGVAHRAELSAQVMAGGGEIALHQLTGTLDDVPLSGGLVIRRGDPPAFLVDLSVDRVTLDPWLPASVGDAFRPAADLAAELHLNVRRATLAGTPIEDFGVDAAIEAGSVAVRRVAGTVRGARVTASGSLGDGGRLTGGRLTVTTTDATPLVELMAPAWRATPALWHGAAHLEVQAAGPQEALTIGGRLTLADARLDVTSAIDLRTAEWSGIVTLRHPGAPRLVATVGLSEPSALRWLPSWLGDGSLSLVAHLAGRPGRVAAEKVELAAGTLRSAGELAFDWSTAEPRLTGRVSADSVALSLPSASSEVPLPLGVLRGWRGDVQLTMGRVTLGAAGVVRDASVAASLADGVLRLDRFAGRLGSGTVAGSLTFDAAASPPTLALRIKVSDAIVTGSLMTGALMTGALGDAGVDLLSGRADASLQVGASGYSPSAVLATLAGRASLTVNEGALTGFDLFRLKQAMATPDPKAAEAMAREALSGGATGFDRLELGAEIGHGDLLFDDAKLIGDAGEAVVTGSMDLTTQALDLRITLRPAVASPPEVTLRLGGSLARPTMTPELAGLARWMANLAR